MEHSARGEGAAGGSSAQPPRYAAPVLIGGLGVIVMSAIALALTGNLDVRYSADHEGTIPVWTRWIPSLVAVALIRIFPPAPPVAHPSAPADPKPLIQQTWVLLSAALLFPALLALSDGADAWYVGIKLLLLVAVPLAAFALSRGATAHVEEQLARFRAGLGGWRWAGPALPLAAWLYLTYATPLATPPSAYEWPNAAALATTLVAVFLINAVVEEYFYRVWLQSRLELLLGRWPAIVLAALMWAFWHVAIQGGRGLSIDLATVFANHGVQGLFLGYLWARYRNLPALLLAHGAINAAGLLIGLLAQP